jgi:hypothetical protein
MYLRCPTLIQKQVFKDIPFVAVDITFSRLKFQIFTHILPLKIENLELSYFYRKLSFTKTF